MNLYIRLLIVFIGSFFKKKLESIFSVSELTFRVLPNDLDLNGHMNNGRYLVIMDLGRLDLIMRNGTMRFMMKQKSVPILGASKIRYRIPLNPFQKYKLHTQILCWDDKWAYMEQRFIIADGTDKDGAVAAIAIVKGNFYSKKNKSMVDPKEMLKVMNMEGVESPPIPNHVQKWIEAEEALREITQSD